MTKFNQVLKSPVGAVVTHPSLSLRIWQPVMQQLTAYFPYPHWARLQKSALAAMQACMLSWPLRCQTIHTVVATPHGRLTYQQELYSLQPASPVSIMLHYSHLPPSLSSYTAGSPPPLHSIQVKRPANSCTQGAAHQSRANAALMSVQPHVLCAQVIAECTQN